jgi:hypothetical protein
LPGEGQVIIISDSDKEEHEDHRANADAMPSSLRVPLAPPTSTNEDDNTSDWVKDGSSGSGSEDEAGSP